MGKVSFHAQVILVSLILIAICLLVPTGRTDAEIIGKITFVEGTVEVLRGGRLPAVPMKVGDEVFAKDIVRTKSGSKAEILFDNNDTLKIAQRSRIDIKEYVTDGGLGKVVIDVPRGRVEAVAENNIIGNTKTSHANKLEISTPTAAVKKGTDNFALQERSTAGILNKKENSGDTPNPKTPAIRVDVMAAQALSQPLRVAELISDVKTVIPTIPSQPLMLPPPITEVDKKTSMLIEGKHPFITPLIIKLQWEGDQNDLRGYLWVPPAAGGNYYEMYNRPGYMGAINTYPYARLERNDTNRLETITISQLLPGKYYYSIFNYDLSGDSPITTSKASVVAA